MEYAHTKSTEEALAHFDVEEAGGYSDEQVKKSLEKYGLNGKSLIKITNTFQPRIRVRHILTRESIK